MRKIWLGLGVLVVALLALGVDFHVGDLRFNAGGKTLRHWAWVDVVAHACADFGDTGGFPCNSTFATGGGGAVGGNTPTFIQGLLSADDSSCCSELSVVLTGSVVGVGHTVVGAASYACASAVCVASIVDDKGNNYNISTSASDTISSQSLTCFYLVNISNSPQTITLNIASPGTGKIRLEWDEYSNIAAFEQANSAFTASPGTGADGISGGAVTAAAANDLLWGATSESTVNAGVQHYTAGTGFTARTNSLTADDRAIMSEDKLFAAAGSASATVTQASNQTSVACSQAFSHT